MSEIDIKVPNIGDFKDVEVIEVLVSEGQTIQKNDPVITIESYKSSIEIPSNYEGKIKSLKKKVENQGSKVNVKLILEIKLKIEEINKKKPKIEKDFKKNEVKKLAIENTLINKNKTTKESFSSASPKARKFARELGVDISQVIGSEKDGRIIEEDIKKFVSSKSNNIDQLKQNKSNKIKNEFNHADYGEIEIKDIQRVKKLS